MATFSVWNQFYIHTYSPYYRCSTLTTYDLTEAINQARHEVRDVDNSWRKSEKDGNIIQNMIISLKAKLIHFKRQTALGKNI